ncbi:MAG: hypothetical protein CM1200mP29_12250 [Verrucomicrobiota bacterium]|nr:MAG: hypothetical protein CM1200mP29_12250 [Verrucomicrobiota bacterium]
MPSPVAGDGVVLAWRQSVRRCSRSRRWEGQHQRHGRLWNSEGSRDGVPSDVCTPLFYQGSFFVLYGEGRERCFLDWSRKPAKFSGRATLIVAHSSAVHRLGGWQNLRAEPRRTVHVSSKSGKVLHRAARGEAGDDQTRASITVAHGRLSFALTAVCFALARADRTSNFSKALRVGGLLFHWDGLGMALKSR